MLVPRCTTPHSSIRQMRIKTQNMIVLTVEFTRIPLFPAGEKPLTTTSVTAYSIPLDASRPREVTESAVTRGGRHL